MYEIMIGSPSFLHRSEADVIQADLATMRRPWTLLRLYAGMNECMHASCIKSLHSFLSSFTSAVIAANHARPRRSSIFTDEASLAPTTKAD